MKGLNCAPHINISITSTCLGSLTCQPSLPDIPPQQIPSLGRGVPQLLADRPPQLQLGRPSLACHCGVARCIIPHYKQQRSVSGPLFLSPVIPAVAAAAGTSRPPPPTPGLQLRLAAAMVVTASPGIKKPFSRAASPSCTSGGG